MERYKLSEFYLNKDNNLFLAPVLSKFNYTDGEKIEKRIYYKIKNSKDLSIFSRELISNINDWPSEYHFSPLRHNLLRHYNFKQTDNVLELGCGCGAITRQLGESKANVTSIEGSLFRAKCAAERCRDLANVKVYCSNFQDILLTPEYDYVTLIGVLEYSSVFFVGDKPFNQCIEIAKSALKKNGKLIIAIENRLGLKYFLGYSEDHTGMPYSGLQDFYQKNTAYTFGKSEITDLLAQNGFVNINFAYPFPDYKLPITVIFESAFISNGFSPSNLISATNSRDYSRPYKHLPLEYFFWKQLEKNNLISDLSNSFLIETSLSSISIDQNLIAKYYTVDRKRQYNVATSFIKDGDQIKVVKENIEKISDNYNYKLIQILKEEKYSEGENLDYFIHKAIAINELLEFIELLKLWIDFLVTNSILKKNESNIFLSITKHNFIDYLPNNIIVKNKKLQVIDTEWIYSGSCTLYSLILRYLSELDLKKITKKIAGKGNPYSKLFKYLGIKYKKKYYKDFLKMENEINLTVSDDCTEKIRGNYGNLYEVKLKLKEAIKKIIKLQFIKTIK